MVEYLHDSQVTWVRFPHCLPLFLYSYMAFQAFFSHRNLRAGEKIQDGPNRSQFHPGPGNHPPVQILTVDGKEYFIKYLGGNFSNDNRLNQFNNKTVLVEGTFVGPICYVTSITKVGP